MPITVLVNLVRRGTGLRQEPFKVDAAQVDVGGQVQVGCVASSIREAIRPGDISRTSS
jgi:hypothetical protein